MPNLGAPELIIIAIVIIALFGWKKLPDMARSLGRSARVFKSEVDELKKDGKPVRRARPRAPPSPVTSSTTPRRSVASPTSASPRPSARPPRPGPRPTASRCPEHPTPTDIRRDTTL